MSNKDNRKNEYDAKRKARTEHYLEQGARILGGAYLREGKIKVFEYVNSEILNGMKIQIEDILVSRGLPQRIIT